MKSITEMNAKERKAYENIKNAAADYIYSLENGCFDNPKESQEYQDYVRTLKDLDTLIGVVYTAAISSVYTGDGAVYFGRGAHAHIRDIRFCGKGFLLEVTSHFCEQYQADVLRDLGEKI